MNARTIRFGGRDLPIGDDGQQRIEGGDPDDDAALLRKIGAARDQVGCQRVRGVDHNGAPQGLRAPIAGLHQQLGADQHGANAEHPKDVQNARVGFRVHADLARRNARRQQAQQTHEQTNAREQDARRFAQAVDRKHAGQSTALLPSPRAARGVASRLGVGLKELMRLYTTAAQALDRKVGWSNLPLPLGIATLVAARIKLRQQNLYDTSTAPSMDKPKLQGISPSYLTARTPDGSYNDLD